MDLTARVIADSLTEFQRRAISALAAGELCAEAAALKSGYDIPAHRIQGARSPAVWWGRVATGVPVGLIAVRWCHRDQKHYYQLTPAGQQCAEALADRL